MLTPFQRLLYNGIGSRKILVAASGPCLRTFDYVTGQFIARWSYLDPEASNASQSPSSHDPNGTSPRKKRKLDNGDVSDSASAEILIEDGSGHQKPRKNGFTIPCITHVNGTKDGKHIVIVTGEDKAVRVLEMTENGGLKQFSKRIMPKRPSAVALTPDEDTILCSDKFGDVYSMPLLGQILESAATTAVPNEDLEEERFKPAATAKTVHSKRNLQALASQQKQKKVKKASETKPKFKHELILGHVSMLTDMACIRVPVSPVHGRTYIITSDRDEHIRVSRGIPQAHIIENFCLGHEQFISKIHSPTWRPETLISGGGDDCLLVWNWRTGSVLEKLDLKNLLLLSEPSAAEQDSLSFAVSGIWSLATASASGVIIAACERVRGLFIFSISSDGQTPPTQSIFKPLLHNVLDIAVLPSERQIIVSLDNLDQQPSNEDAIDKSRPFVVVLQLQNDGSWTETNGLSAVNAYALQTEELLTESIDRGTWTSVFYNVEHLRKRGDLEGAEG